MEEEVSLEKYLLLPTVIINKTSLLNNIVNLLSESFIDQFYYSDLRKDLLKYFEKYNDSLIYFNSRNYQNSFSSNIFGIELIQSNLVSDKVSKNTKEKVDAQIWINDFYTAILDLSSKLTNQEAIYVVRSLFLGLSEENICEELSISRNCLQKIKKSALVKLKITFESNEYIKLD